jgi:hypothetical protein
MMDSNDVDDWGAHFANLRPSLRRAEREARAKQERRTQLTEKQRERSTAVRTEQINFRCSAEFKADTAGMQAHLQKKRGLARKPSIADVLEEALALLAKTEGYNG